MDHVVVTPVCPHCAWPATEADSAGEGVCPHCGRLLRPAEAASAGVSDMSINSEATPEPTAEESALIAGLREAFQLGPDVLDPSGPPRLTTPAHATIGLRHPLELTALPMGYRLDDFEILDELGRGGMGVVYRARQLALGREVALKVLPGYAHHSRRAVQRFRAEAQAAARLHHTNVVSVYAQGEHKGQYYYVMELVDGVGLDTVIRSRPDLLSSTGGRSSSAAARLTGGSAPGTTVMIDRGPAAAPAEPPPDSSEVRWTHADCRHVAALFAEVADALACAHDSGVIHRDVKPHNLLLGRPAGAPAGAAVERLHLTDFGLARLMDEPHLTVSGEIMGTPAYLSPEQVRGDARKIDHRTDIYSLGVTLYEVLTRRKPFDGETREQIMSGICTLEPVAPRRLNPSIPLDLETICLHAIEKEVARRHPTAAALADDLRRFSEGRPILSRRVSRFEKAAKWVRRHKALSAAIGAITAVLVLGPALAWSVHTGRQREASALTRRAHDQLAYFDYRVPELAKQDLDRAAALGAKTPEYHLTRALAALGASDQATATAELQIVLRDTPADPAALYLLAWAQNRAGARGLRSAAFDQAEALRTGSGGRPPVELSAEAWFYRGLAVHFDDPQAAIESYRQANTLRAREHGFYPQAILHLARARNQQLYATRRVEYFGEAAEWLNLLIQQGYYRAFPHYLLSITHRLAAEIYTGSSGARGDASVGHYTEAIKWAREGQRVDPDDDLPVTAEAECLESMGQFAAALAARDRALRLAKTELRRCQVYHYRWRLHYWLGDFPAALADVGQHAACVPESRCDAHFYPALVLAEAGDLPAALTHARALATDTPHDPVAVVWSATCLRLLGQWAEADTLLAQRATDVDFSVSGDGRQSETWTRALYDLARGERTLDDLLAFAQQQDTVAWRLSSEAYFHAAVRLLASGDRDAALDAFQRAYRCFDGEQGYTFRARLFCVQLEKNLAWPAWLAVSWGGPHPVSVRDDSAAVAPSTSPEEKTGHE